jgi:hypothetical protein
MKVKVFQSNHNGKIEFTRAELEKLLNEVYTDGYNEGKSSHWTWTSPYYTGTDTTLLSDKTPINQATITGTNTEINKDLLAQISSTTESKVEAPKITTTNNSTKPNAYTVTMKCSEADINKAANALRELLNTPNALSTAKIDDAFDKLAKELNF